MSNGVQNQGEIAMQTDKYTKVVLTLIAIGLFLNLAMYLRVTPAGAASDVLEVVRTRQLEIVNEAGRSVVQVGSSGQSGLLVVKNKSDQVVVSANGVDGGNGALVLYDKSGEATVHAGVGPYENGGAIIIANKTGEAVVTLSVEEDGNGKVGVWNRKGAGRTLEPR